MTIIEIKAKCYDILAEIEYLQKKLQETNAMLSDELNKQKNDNGEIIG